MARSGLTGMKLHQGLSFSSMMMEIPKAEALFWPGCALMNLDTEILEKALAVLRRGERDISLCTCCCGQPSVYLFPEQAQKRQQKLLSRLKQQGVKRIYTACPNCTVQLKKLGLDVHSVWPLLAELCRKEELQQVSGAYVWHDPCVTKRDAQQQEAVRKLLSLSDCAYMEPEHTRGNSICCGNFHMTHSLRPEAAKKARLRRLAEFPQERIIVSSCEGCLNAFRSEGRECLHLLELLFGESKRRGWGNRIKTTMKQK